ncbi:CLUMA_CG004936, isoform A [Clunio marinus]|uniref:CLUMA_CG004936, isoform A n=1 Tax=Clunio marinus TaxID=568069 RepID=A0A1J1HT65_9DIPT|nr:CLUMA_CG004936, isoform A [Clunio marinus]
MKLFILFVILINFSFIFAIEPVVIVHGGAGSVAESRFPGKYRGTILAAKVGYNVLKETGSVLDAVEHAVRSMELDDDFNAGYGSVLTRDGEVQMDACIMDGRTMDVGSGTGVQDIYHPITLARRVMEKTQYNFLGATGAMELAKSEGFWFLPKDALVSDFARDGLERWKQNQLINATGKVDIGEGNTVGAVAIDEFGNIAAATSTGGITGKMSGRIGDAPMVGAGTYSDNNLAGLSATGEGEVIMKAVLVFDILKRMEYLGEDIQTASKIACDEMTAKFNGDGGVIAIDKNVHGGAGDIPMSRVHGKLRGVKQAAQLGFYVLNQTGSAMDAVEAAVKHMEIDDFFNAGYGAVVTTEGTVELEASVMDGNTLKAGCVAGVIDIMHPISVARRVMEKTPHNFLGFHGANQFIKQQEFEVLKPGSLVTDYAREALEEWKECQRSGGLKFAKTEIGRRHDEKSDTVGAVAIDRNGNIAVATSTGGITGKLPGRIGDTPVIGGGTYCDNRSGGVSTTGHGETIMKACLAHDIIKRIEYLGEDAQTATEKACKNMTERFIGTGGAITIDKNYNVGISFTSRRMAWAYQKNDQIHYGIERDDHMQETLHLSDHHFNKEKCDEDTLSQMRGKARRFALVEPCLIVHGGAGTIPASREAGKVKGVKKAACDGYKTLIETESAIQAVEKAVNVMELDEYFNAGYGSVLTSDGIVEMDASIMCGRTLNFGCVSLVTDILYPISLARIVMRKSKYKFLSEEGARNFARRHGVGILHPPGQLKTDYTTDFMQNFINLQHLASSNGRNQEKIFEAVGETGTVGAVAIDLLGNIAVATSTGGIGGKLHGRIGDTPIIGCGTYCDNKFGGISSTGHGDILMRACLAHDVIKRMEYLNENIQIASQNASKNMLTDFKGTGGVVELDCKGNVSVFFTSQRMAWAYQEELSLHYGIKKNDHFEQNIDDYIDLEYEE